MGDAGGYNAGGPGFTEAVNQLTNIARQLSFWSQSITNSQPVPTTTASPKFTAVNLSTAASVIVAASTIRHGIVLHNPGTTTCYVYQTGMASPPTTSVLAGALLIAAGSSVVWPSPQFTNINAGFSAFSSTGSSQPFTVIEFF